ncbi:MAG: adenosine kinase [Treponema sp.]|jgi:sugar/nucleoside kinase (ribokinase family)|nr:adenosine kinase [Treponema sp.]
MQEQEPLDILCFGNAIIDVFAEVDKNMCAGLGFTEPLQHIAYEKILEALSLLPDFTTTSGGGGANVAKIASLLGLKAGFTGAVGSIRAAPDRFAALFEAEQTEAGVHTFLTRKNAPTGVCLVLQEQEGGTRIAACPSASLLYTPADIPEAAIKAAKVIVIDGYTLGLEESVSRILELADKYGTVVALDVGSPALAAERAEQIAAYCQDYPVFLFMNEDEAEAFYRALNKSDDGLEEEDAPVGSFEKKEAFMKQVYAFFKKFTARDLFPIVAVKLGPRGSVVFAGGTVYREETIAVLPLETTGAGDAFCAAFLAAWIHGKSLVECANLGNKVASQVLDVPGTRIDREKLAGFAKIITATKKGFF